MSGLTLITGSRALVSDSTGLPVASSVTSTTLAFLDATSSVQTQLDSKLPEAGGTMSGILDMGSNKITNLTAGVNPTDAANVSQVNGVASVPTGAIMAYGAASAPTGWLLCDGSAVSRTTYSGLFGVIGTTYGSGNGTTTFNVPTTANNIPIGAGSIAALGASAGSATHTISSSELPTHNHTINITDPGHAHNDYCTGPAGQLTNGGAGQNTMGRTTLDNLNVQSATTGITASSSNAGSSTAMSLVQPVVGVTYIIKA